jgi:hypothetical protein
MESRLKSEQNVEITTYCCSLMHMPLSAAVIGFGLDSDKQSATELQNYLQSDYVRQGMPDMAVETQILNWLTAVASPPIPLPPLWKAMAVKYMIDGVKRGMSLLNVQTDPNQAKYLVLAGWTPEQAEMVSQYDYGPPSPLIVRPSAAWDPFVDDGQGGSVKDVMDGFKIPFPYGRDCQIPKVVLPRDRAGQPRFGRQTPSYRPSQPSDVHQARFVEPGKLGGNDAVHAVALQYPFSGNDSDNDETGRAADIYALFLD